MSAELLDETLTKLLLSRDLNVPEHVLINMIKEKLFQLKTLKIKKVYMILTDLKENYDHYMKENMKTSEEFDKYLLDHSHISYSMISELIVYIEQLKPTFADIKDKLLINDQVDQDDVQDNDTGLTGLYLD